MKEQLIEQLTATLLTEDIMSVRELVRDIRNQWKSESVKDRQLQFDAFKENEANVEMEFVFHPHQLDETFKAKIAEYEQRIEEAGKILAALRQKNLEEKNTLLTDFQKLIQEEENVGKAFQWHKEIKEKWDAIGDVPGDKYHELQEQWQRLNHAFFYNINIYKELQAHDLKINQKRKEELIEEARSLEQIESINELELMIKKLQREFVNVGPSPREQFKETGDTFFSILREFQNKIQAHYDAIQAESDQNLARKKELIQKTKDILNLDFNQATSWNKWTEELVKLQEEWKTIGWTKKKDNEESWLEFRGLCDAFFERKKVFFEARKTVQREHQLKKEAIIEKAKQLQDSTDWKKTTEDLKKLQEEWKKVGAAEPREENKLWQRFRSHCDHFFNRKKVHFSGMIEQQEQNLLLKNDLLQEMENIQLSGNRNEDLNMLRSYNDRWKGVGHVPRGNADEINKKYNAIMDKLYGTLNATRQEKDMMQYRNRVENIRSQGDTRVVKKERQLLQDKIDRLVSQIKQMENNMGIFTGKGAESLKKEIEKKIKLHQQEVNEIRMKMSLLED